MDNMKKNVVPKKSYSFMSKLLPMALFVGCQTFNPSAVAVEAPKPTLDILHDSGAIIVSSGEVYPESEFTFSEVVPADVDNLPLNVIKYFDVNNMDDSVHYYEIGLKNSVFGTGSNEKYFKWAKDNNGVKLVATPNQSESVLTIKYDDSTFIDNVLNPAGGTISVIKNVYVGQNIKSSIDNKGLISSITSDFVGNDLAVNSDDTFNYSTILSEAGAKIDNISSSFIANTINVDSTKSVYGPLIKVLGQGAIGEMKSEFIGNNVTTNAALSGGLIIVNGAINDLRSDFILNSVSSDTANIYGGLLANDGGIVQSLNNSRFLGNNAYSGSGAVRGSVLYNADTSTMNIVDSVFTGNSAVTNSGSVFGGALYDAYNTSIQNTSFYGNYAIALNGGIAKGGAIYTDSGLTISASNGKTTEFTNNYVVNNGEKSNQAIYVQGRNNTLTLKSTENGKIIMNDDIAGDAGFRTSITGDSTGNVYIFGDIIDSNVSANSTNINLINNAMKDYNWLSLSSDETARYDIDINFGTKTSDTFTLGSGSAGAITIDKLKLIGALPTESTIVKLLTAPDVIKIAISDNLRNQYYKETHGANYEVVEAIDNVTYWNREYSLKTQKDVVKEGLRAAVSDSSRTNPDSIEYYVETEQVVLSTTKLGDTLKLLNQADIGDRSFLANNPTDVYEVGDDLGSTAKGTLTIRGLYSDITEKLSKIDAGEHTLFELDKAGTHLVLKDVDIVSESNVEGAIVKATAANTSITIEGQIPLTIDGVAGTNGFVNNGNMDIETSVTSNVGVKGDGVLNVKKDLTLTDGASVLQDSVSVANNATLKIGSGGTLSSDNISIASGAMLDIYAIGIKNDINNNTGFIQLRDGTLQHVLSGTGVSIINGDVTIDHDAGASISNAIKMTSNSVLSAKAGDIGGNVSLYDVNSSDNIVVNLNGGTLAKNINLASESVININGDVTYDASVIGHIYVKDGSKLTTNASNLAVTNAATRSTTTVEDGGELHITGGGTYNSRTASVAPGSIDGDGHVYIEGNTASSNSIASKYLTINPNVTLETTGALLTSENIQNNGVLSLHNSSVALTSAINGTGYVTVFDDPTVATDTARINADINQKLIVPENTTFGTDAGRLNGEIINNGILYLNFFNKAGYTTLKKPVNGTGLTHIYTSLNNNYVNPETGEVGVDINQDIRIGTPRVFITNADHIGGTVTIEGATTRLDLTGGTLRHSVSGDGITRVLADSVVVANDTIQSSAGVQVYERGSLTIDADNLESNVTLSKNGKIRLGDGTLLNTISGETGITEIIGDVTSDRRISSALTIADTGTFHAGLLSLQKTINNDGAFYTFGNLTKEITGSGTTYIDGSMSFQSGGAISTTGKFNLNGGNLSASGLGSEYTLGTATGQGNLSLTIDTVANTSQSFLLNENSNGIFNIVNADIVRPSRNVGDTGTIQILKGGNSNDFAYLTINSEGGKLYSENTDSDEVWDEVQADTYFDASFSKHSRYYTIYSSVMLATMDTPNDSIQWTVDRVEFDRETEERGDLLRMWNQYNAGDTEKFFRFRTANDEYKSLEEPGGQAAGIENIIGVSSVNGETGEVTRSKINLGYNEYSEDSVEHRRGISVNSGSVLNISNIEFKNGWKDILYGSGGKFGNIDSDTHEVTGGIINTTFDNVNYEDSNTTNMSAGLVNLNNTTISQIKDSSFSNNSLKFTNTNSYDIFSVNTGGLYLTGSNAGSTYVDDESNTQYVGGIINTEFNNNILTLAPNSDADKNLNSSGLAMFLDNSKISQITDSKISNNTVYYGNNVYGTAVYMAGGSVLDLFKNSEVKNNSSVDTNNSYGSIYLTGVNTVINKIDNVLFQDNYATYGGAINVDRNANIGSIVNSEFKNNSSKVDGGALRLINRKTVDLIKDTLFEGNYTTTGPGGGAISVVDPYTKITKIDNVTFKGNHSTAVTDTTYGGAIRANGNSSIDTILNSTFEGNYIDTDVQKYIGGGAIGLYAGSPVINNILGSVDAEGNIKYTVFKDNYIVNNYGVYTYGGAIYVASGSVGTIDKVKFVNNYAELKAMATTFGGGAIFSASRPIEKITNSIFEGNYLKNEDKGGSGAGGAIRMNGTSGVLGELSDTKFINNSINTYGTHTFINYGGAIALTEGGKITNLNNVLFEENSINTVNGMAGGGALSISSISEITNGIVNSRFINNSVETTKGPVAAGGAIWSAADVKIIAKGENGLSEFTGNTTTYKGKTENIAITFNNQQEQTLTLEANTGGHILMNDSVNDYLTIGNATAAQIYKYSAVLTGDLNSKISLFGDLINANVTSNGTNITTANNKIFGYNFNSWNSEDTAKWTIDINFEDQTADNFSMKEASAGRVYIDNLNILANSNDFSTVQVLKTPNDNIQLELNENKINVVEDIRSSLGDTVYNNDVYHQSEGYALATTDTTNDSIIRLVDKDYDNLRIIGESTLNDKRYFNFRTDDEYTVTENLTPIASGEFTINGTEDGSVINADGHNMFDVDNETVFNINNTKITGADDIININNAAAVLNLSNAYIDGNIVSGNEFTLSIQGDDRTTITGDVTGANATLRAGELAFAETTFKDATFLDISAGSARLDNDVVENYEISRLNVGNNAKFDIDMDMAAQSADNITVSDTRSAGTVYIENINFTNASENTTGFVTQVLKGNTDALQLTLSDSISRVKLADISRLEADVIREVTGFNDVYYNRERAGILWGDVYLTTVDVINDSIGVNVSKEWSEDSTPVSALGDTLVLVNQSDLPERIFESQNATDSYILSDNLGATHEGIFTVNGVVDSNNNRSTVDLNNHDGFVIGENTQFTINNTHLTGSKSDNPITVTDSSSEVTVGGSIIDGNIVGTEHFNLDLNGTNTTTLNGQVLNASTTLTKGGLEFNADTFADDSTSLTTVAGSIYMDNGDIEDYKFSDLTSGERTKYYIDVDLEHRTADTITAQGSGVITLEEFNLVGKLQNVSIDDEYIIQILRAENDSLQLQLTETIASQLDNDYHLGDNHVILSTDEIDPHTLWNREYNQVTQDYEVWGRIALASTTTDNDSLKLYNMHLNEVETSTSIGDTLTLLSQADIGDREFVFEASNNVYNLGTNSDLNNEIKAGKIDVIGVAGVDGEGNKELSTINMNHRPGWKLDKETELSINNVNFTNISEQNRENLINVTNSDAIVNLNNVNIVTPKTNAILNAGTINATGGDVYLTTGISGDGTLNVTGADTVFAGNSSIIQSAINVNNGSLTMTDGSIRGTLTIGQDGTATVNTQGINHDVANAGTLNLKKDGTLIYNVTGDGTTNIKANIVNGAEIENDVNILAGAEFSTAREKVSGSIDNAAKLNLSGTMSDVITGDGTTTVITFLNMYDGAGIAGTLNANNGNISTQDNTISNINIGTLTGDATYSIDVLASGAQSTADKFIVGNTSSGKIILDNINFVTGSVMDPTFKVQVVDTNGTDDVYIELSDALKEQKYMAGRTARPEEEDVNRITAYTRIYHTLSRGGDLYGNLVESTTSTNKDSISIAIKDEYTVWDADDQRIETGILGDTLALWNQLNTNEVKQFTFDSAATYKVGENYSTVTGVGETKGTNVSILGVTDGANKSTIDLNGKTGFELANATEFTLDNVKLTGNETALVNVSNAGAKININDSYIDGNITGSAKYTVDINEASTSTGTSTLNGTLTNADTSLLGGKLKFNTDTFKAVTDTLTTKSDATIDLVNGTAGDTYEINKLLSDGDAKWNIDVSVTSEAVFSNDVIQLASAESAGVIKLETLNITSGGFGNIPEDMRGKTFVMQILKAQNNNIQLDLSDYVKEQQLTNKDYLLSESYEGYVDEAVAIHTKYNKDYMRTHTYLDTYGRLGLVTKQTTNDSIGITVNSSNNRNESEKLDDTLYLVNTAQIDDRTFDFVTADDEYVVTKDLGITATGEMSVNGVFADDKRSTINGTDTNDVAHDLFKLADEQTLNLNNVKITGAKSVAELANEDAVLNLNNVEISGNTSGITNTSGKVNLTGTNIIANNITGGGNTEIKSGATQFSGNSSITQTAINVTGGSLAMADGSVNGALSISDGASATVNVEGIDHAIANEGDLTFKKDGTLAYNVTGGGTTNINGKIVNGAQIANNVNVLAGAEFTTSRQAVGGKIDNANLLNLSGTLSDRITGNGTTNVNQTLNMYDGAGIDGTLNANNGTISTQDTKISNINIGKLTGNGSYAIDITSTGSADKFVAGADSSGKVAITGLNFLDSQNLNPNFKAQVIDSASSGNLYLELSDEIKAQRYYAGRTSRDEEDTVNRITAYTQLYQTYERGGDLKGSLVEATTNTTNDSVALEVKDEYTVWDTTRTQTGLMGDTLALWNQLNTTEEKQFTFDSAATYKVGENYPTVTGVGETKGANVSILGVTSGNNKSTVDLNGKTGFELANATNFTLDNVKLTGNETALITVSNADAQINIKDSYVDGNITGSAKYTVDINGTGTSTINGTIANADTTLSSGTLKINTDTFAATTDTLTTTEDANIDLSDNHSGDTFVINKLTSDIDAKWVIDIDVTNKLADKIQLTDADSSGKVLLNNLNITFGDFDDIPEDMRNKEFIVQVLKAQNDNIQLDLSDYVKSQLGDKNYLIASGILSTVDEEIKQHTQWDYDYKHTVTWGDEYGKLRLATTDTTNDSVGIAYDHRDSHDEVEKMDDTLYLVNTAQINDRTFDFVTANDEYVATKDLGTTATGEMSVNGVFADGKRSTINGTDTNDVAHDLFNLADEQTLNLNNVKITGANSVAKLTNEDAVLNLNNVEISGNTNGITNAGTVNLKGTNIIANNITGAGNTNLKSGSTTNNANIEQSTFTIENAAAQLTNEGTIRAAFDNSVGAGVTNKNSIVANGGSNSGAITGVGTFENTTGNTFINNGTITQTTVTNDGTWANNNDIIAAISNNSNGNMTSNANNLKGAVTNAGHVILTGGTTQNNYGGASTGTVEVTGDLTVNKTISGNELKLTSGITQLTKDGSISGAEQLTANGGTLSIMDDYIAENPVDLGKVVLDKNLDLYIDADFATEKADVISASKGVIQGTDDSGNKNHILINNINIMSDAIEKMSMYVDVVDDTLKNKNYVALGSNVEATVLYSDPNKGGKDSFLVTYDDERGQLLVEYSTLPVAVASDTKEKVYAMNDNETVGDLGELHGNSLSISGNGHSVTGGGNSEGITVNKDQTLSVNNVDSYSGFDTAINNNGGTVNVRNTDFTGNTTDIANNKDTDGNGGNLVLEGTDNINTIIGNGTTKLSSYTSGTTTVNADVTVNDTLVQDKIQIDKDNKLTTKATSNIGTLDNAGTYNNEGTATIADSLNNNGAINNGTDSSNAKLALNGTDMNIGGTVNNAEGSEIAINGNGKTTLSAKTTNNGALNIDSDTDITSELKGNKGTTTIGSDVAVAVKGDIEQKTVENNGTVTVDNAKGSIKTSDSIINNGTITSKAGVLKADNGIKNNNQLNLTGGENKNTITGDGTTTFSGNSKNSGNITQKSVVNDGTLVNNSDIKVSDGLTNNKDGVLTNNAKVDGDVINKGKFVHNGTITGEVINNKGAELINNSSIDTKLTNDGKVNNKGLISSEVENQSNGVITTKIAGLTSDSINNDGTIRYTDGGSTVADVKGNGRIELRNNDKGTVFLNNNLDNNTLALYNGTLVFGKQKEVAGFEANGGNINSANGKIDTINLGNVVINKKTGLRLDFRLDDESSDKFLNNGIKNNDGAFNVTAVNITGNTTKDYIRVHLGDTTTLGRANVTSDTIDLPRILTPIRYLNGRLSGGWLTYSGYGNQYKDFNPAVMASSVAQQVGGFLTQSQTLQDSFFHMNRYTKYMSSQRLAAETINNYAISEGNPIYNTSSIPETSQAMWTKPYTTFEKVSLKGGPGVSNVAYGALYGGDSDLYNLRHGYKGVVSAFVGYNGNHMSYDGISMNEQGGTLGVTGTLYKGNFFTGMTISAGASAGEAYTMYGTDKFAMMTAGIANKTGYNWEINGGKIIIQPSLYTGYTFVNTFDYTNAAGVRIDSDPLNTIQLVPGVKVIGNTKTGWQPYAGVDMVWNINVGGSHVTASQTTLPQLSVKPYIQYGAGIQKSWSDRFTAFFQTMLRNGGRTGIVLQAGFRWNIGKDSTKVKVKKENIKNNRKVIKSTNTVSKNKANSKNL